MTDDRVIERPDLFTLRGRYPGELLLAFRRDPLALLDRLTASGAHVARLRAGPRWVAAVGSPEAARELLVERETDLVRGRALVMTEFLLGDGLLTDSGEAHREARRRLAPAFSRQRLDALGARIASRANALAEEWIARGRVDAEWEMRRLSLHIAADVLFGYSLASGERNAILGALDAALPLFGRTFNPLADILNRLPTPGTRRLLRARARLWRTTDAILHARRQRRDERGDVLGHLLAWEREGGLSPEATRGQALQLLAAGHETTGAGLAFALDDLARHPEWQERIASGADDTTGGGETARRVFAESMRHRPPAWVASREAVRDTTLAGVPLARGTVVLMSPWVLGREPRLWRDPARFDPDRFALEATAERHRFAYLPFSAGRHGCLAERLAWMEGEQVLSALMARIRLAPVSPFPGLAARTTLRPSGPVWLDVRTT
ncbi:cytochrome P450 [Rubricoccus marinus]|nr:cytochrome P450 [Rubricoccus marinus]